MSVERIWARKFRSLGDVELDLGGITVVVGENGTGKTNLYRSLRLLVEAASGQLSQAILAEGGMPSMLWAGAEPRPRSEKAVRLVVGLALDGWSWELRLGLPPTVALPPSASCWTPRSKKSCSGRATGRAGNRWSTASPGRRFFLAPKASGRPSWA